MRLAANLQRQTGLSQPPPLPPPSSFLPFLSSSPYLPPPSAAPKATITHHFPPPQTNGPGSCCAPPQALPPCCLGLKMFCREEGTPESPEEEGEDAGAATGKGWTARAGAFPGIGQHRGWTGQGPWVPGNPISWEKSVIWLGNVCAMPGRGPGICVGGEAWLSGGALSHPPIHSRGAAGLAGSGRGDSWPIVLPLSSAHCDLPSS